MRPAAAGAQQEVTGGAFLLTFKEGAALAFKHSIQTFED
jgi:hypothetical protein